LELKEKLLIESEEERAQTADKYKADKIKYFSQVLDLDLYEHESPFCQKSFYSW